MNANEEPMPSEEGVRALRTGAAVVVRTDILSVRVEGADRERFLNGMLSNDVSKLKEGETQRSLKASAKGRVEGSLRVRRESDAYVLDLHSASAAKVAGELVKFVVMDDVQLVDISDRREVVGVYGPEAAQRLERLGVALSLPPAGRFIRHEDVTLLRDDSFGIVGYELHTGPGASFLDRWVHEGGEMATRADLEVIRVEAGYPIDGAELNEETIPLEANLDEAIDLKKGCFIGQEVIARATHRGGVKRRLVGLRFHGPLPAVGAELWPSENTEDVRVRGRVTSRVMSPTLQQSIGLGFVHVDFGAVGTKLEARFGGQSVLTEVVELPHVSATNS